MGQSNGLASFAGVIANWYRNTLSNKSCSVIPAPSLMLLAKDTKIPIGSEFTVEKNFMRPMSSARHGQKMSKYLILLVLLVISVIRFTCATSLCKKMRVRDCFVRCNGKGYESDWIARTLQALLEINWKELTWTSQRLDSLAYPMQNF